MRKPAGLLLAVAIVFQFFAAAVDASTLTLAQAFSLAERNDPSLKAGKLRAEESEMTLAIAKSKYFPTLDFGALDSTGFPGSTGSSIGVAGLIASPYRSGAAAGVFSNWSLFDRERDLGVDAARWNLKSSEEGAAVIRQKVYQRTLETFVDASRARAQSETWVELGAETEKILTLVKKLVKTGQHSPVSQSLVEDQAFEAELKLKVFQERYAGAVQRLSLVVGLPAQDIEIPPSNALGEDALAFLDRSGVNPLISKAKADVEASRSEASRRSAERWPKVAAVGSAGVMQSSRLVQEQNYAAAVAIDLPLFEGFRINREVQRANAAAEETSKTLDGVKLAIEGEEARLDADAAAARERLEILQEERTNAREALKMSKVRYISYRGILVDVREALRDLIRIETDLNEAKADLILALGSKAILDGAFVH